MSWRWQEEDQSFRNEQNEEVFLKEVVAEYGPAVDLSVDLLCHALNAINKKKLQIEEEEHAEAGSTDGDPTSSS